MKRKQINYKKGYSLEEHAIAMFDQNSEWFWKNKNEFDILPYSNNYYTENFDCFKHADKLEITIFISILKEKGYIEQTGNPYNIVRITELGEKHLTVINDSKAKYSK